MLCRVFKIGHSDEPLSGPLMALPASMAYADQTDRDWNAFLAAIKAGRIVAGEP